MVGIVPNRWYIKIFPDLCEITSKLVDPHLDEFRNLPHIGNANIEKSTGKLLWYKSAEEDGLISGKYFFTSTDVLYGKINPQFAKACFPQFEGLCSADMYPLSCKEGVIPQFLLYILLSKQFTDYTISVSMRSGMPKVNREELNDYECVLPPISEQRNIAAVLSDTDAYITSLERLIAKKRAIKQGAMQELLTGKRRLEGFSGNWVKDEFIKFADIFRGGSPRPIQAYLTTRSDGVNWIKIGDVAPNAKYINSTEERIIPEGAAYSRPVSKGDFILSNSMSFGRPYILNIDGCIHDGWLTIQNYRENFDTDFLYYLLSSEGVMQQYINMAAGSSVQNLNKDKVSKVIVLKPPVTEQTAIAQILSDMDAEIDSLTTKLTKLKNIKQGMMHELLTGHIRLLEEDSETVNAAKVVELQKRDPKASLPTRGHNQQFNDAVMIAGIVNALYSDKYLLGRKKVQKCLYLLRRHQDESTVAFKKKAAGPYADEVRYKGGEPIAQSAHYIATTTIKDKGTSFARGKNITQALGYIESWGKQGDIKWVADKLKFKKVDDLELLATVDMAICDLEESGSSVSVDSIKHLIATNEEWKEKLKKQTFSDANIARAIQELQNLLHGGN